MKPIKTILILYFTFSAAQVYAGYEQPVYLDGCRSINGRFEITAKLVERGKTSHGPNRWRYVWKDLQENKVVEFDAQGIQGGQTRGQLFIAPDGETFAFWNHITMFWKEKSHMHASSHGDVVKRDDPDIEKFRTQPIFKNRLIIYRKDGSILKSLHVGDFLRESEWRYVLPVFNRAEWLRPYDDLNFKATPREAYAFTRVSPDYTVLAFQVGDRNKPREVRVSLTDGTILADNLKLTDKNKIPVRMYQGDDHIPKNGGDWLEAYTPSLDPVRTAGTYRIDTIEEAFPPEKAPKKKQEFKAGKVEMLTNGLAKGDTPSWLDKFGRKPEETGRLIFTDLEANTLYSLFPANEKTVLRAGATRGRIVNRTFYGLIDGKIASWELVGKPNEPKVIVAKGHQGREVSLNDMVVSSRGLIYFTTLKDPEKGRLSVLDPKTGKVTVLFDGEQLPTLANPNGIALSRAERFLYVGISNYKNRKHSGVYAFPILADGTINVEAGKAKPRIPVKAPDGIATDRQGNIYFTAGNTVHVYSPYATPLAKIRIPKGSGTNLCFGGEDRLQRTLFITTRNAVYAVETPIGGK